MWGVECGMVAVRTHPPSTAQGTTLQGECCSHARMAIAEPQRLGLAPPITFITALVEVQKRFLNNVCFEWHFARKHDHFVEVFALRNASSPQRNTRVALLCTVTARYVLSAVTAQPLWLLDTAGFTKLGFSFEPQGTS